MDFFIPLVQKGLKYVQSLKEEFPQVGILENEIESRLTAQMVTPLWYLLLGFRIQAAVSKISEDEVNFYEHIDGPGIAIITGLTYKDAWKNYEKSLFIISNYIKPHKNKSVETQVSQGVPLDEVYEILNYIEKELSACIFWNAYEQGKLGVLFLVHSYIHDIFPLGMPKKGAIAHSLKFSPLAFTVHDYVHPKQDPRRKALKQFVINKIYADIKAGKAFHILAPLISEQALKRYQLLKTGFNNLFDIV